MQFVRMIPTYVTIVDIKMRLLIRLASKAYFTYYTYQSNFKKFRAANSTMPASKFRTSISCHWVILIKISKCFQAFAT
jgi:hypothetical protein